VKNAQPTALSERGQLLNHGQIRATGGSSDGAPRRISTLPRWGSPPPQTCPYLGLSPCDLTMASYWLYALHSSPRSHAQQLLRVQLVLNLQYPTQLQLQAPLSVHHKIITVFKEYTTAETLLLDAGIAFHSLGVHSQPTLLAETNASINTIPYRLIRRSRYTQLLIGYDLCIETRFERKMSFCLHGTILSIAKLPGYGTVTALSTLLTSKSITLSRAANRPNCVQRMSTLRPTD